MDTNNTTTVPWGSVTFFDVKKWSSYSKKVNHCSNHYTTVTLDSVE